MDKLKTYSLISNAVLFIVLLILLRFVGCGHGQNQPCPEVGFKTDTIVKYIAREDTVLTHVPMPVPSPRKLIAADRTSIAITDSGCAPSVPSASCADSAMYEDTVYRPNNFRAVLREIVSGNRIVSRSLDWANLTPIEVRTVTNTLTVQRKDPFAKLYLGAELNLRWNQPLSSGGIDVAPAASVVFVDRYMLDLGYYVLGGEISAGLKVKLSFRKK